VLEISRLRGSLEYVFEHAFTGYKGEGFSRESCGGKPGRNNTQNTRWHVRS
jgi:hypothetical protein